jgi:polysaccharide export outer membrane protein
MGCRTSAWGWALVAVLLLSGCAQRTQNVRPPSDEPYRIGLEDVIDVAVWRDPDLSRVVPVRPDGFISLPMAGEVLAAGKTPRELEVEIHKALKAYVQEPRVTVIVHEINAPRVYVTGEVSRPGMYPMRGHVSVLQAIALAGGFSDFADKRNIMIIRRDGKGMSVNYTDLVATRDDQRASVWLMPGDTVVVP